MIECTLLRSDKKELKILIPQNGYELKLSNKIDFDVAYMDLINWLSIYGENITEKKYQYIELLIKAIASFTGCKLSEFLEIDSTYISSINEKDLLEHFNSLSNTKTNKQFNIEELESSLLKIYNLIFDTIHSIQPELKLYGEEEFIYEYKNQFGETIKTTLSIPTIWVDAITSETNYNSISVKQLIEMLKIRDNYSKIIDDEKDKGKTPDITGTWLFSKLIGEISLLCLKKENGEVEKIPIDTDQFNKWFSERMKMFENIDYQTAVNIEYWFNSFWDWLKNKPVNNYFFNTKDPVDKYEAEAIQKMKAANEIVFHYVGWKVMLSRLIDINAWQQNGVSTIESVNNAPATEAIELLSIENSK